MPNARELPPPIDPKKEPVTLHILTGKLDHLFNNVKELVEATARGTENVLRKEIQQTEKRLDNKIDSVEKQLDKKIDDARSELKGEMHQMEKRLSDKIDGIGAKVDNHETRITTLENTRPQH